MSCKLNTIYPSLQTRGSRRVNQIFLENYWYNQQQYEITGDYYYRQRALHYNDLMKR
jgi:hypothetical protein